MRELFEPESPQDTCNFCHSFGGFRRAVGRVHFDDDAELTLLIKGNKLNVSYESSDYNAPDIDVDFGIWHCPVCGRKL